MDILLVIYDTFTGEPRGMTDTPSSLMHSTGATDSNDQGKTIYHFPLLQPLYTVDAAYSDRRYCHSLG